MKETQELNNGELKEEQSRKCSSEPEAMEAGKIDVERGESVRDMANSDVSILIDELKNRFDSIKSQLDGAVRVADKKQVYESSRSELTFIKNDASENTQAQTKRIRDMLAGHLKAYTQILNDVDDMEKQRQKNDTPQDQSPPEHTRRQCFDFQSNKILSFIVSIGIVCVVSLFDGLESWKSRRQYTDDTLRLRAILACGRCNENDVLWLNKMLDLHQNEKNVGRTQKQVDDMVDQSLESSDGQSFFLFMDEVISRMRRLGRIRTSETYTATLSSFRRFRKNRDLLIDEINSRMMEEYEAYLKGCGISMNTVSFYNRILRAAYNRAVGEGLTMQCYPFKNVYTGTDKTVKRAIPIESVRRIKGLDLSFKPMLEFARDMFMFSFYTRGMSFVDMAYLKKSDLKNGVLTYRRKKTGHQLHIKWETCMREIVEKYPNMTTEYMLPMITNKVAPERKQYENMLHLINRKLKTVAELADLSVPLSMYVSRHSWASIAKYKNIPLSVISESMGHDSETTTQIYLASLDTSVLDRANKLILKDL